MAYPSFAYQVSGKLTTPPDRTIPLSFYPIRKESVNNIIRWLELLKVFDIEVMPGILCETGFIPLKPPFTVEQWHKKKK